MRYGTSIRGCFLTLVVLFVFLAGASFSVGQLHEKKPYQSKDELEVLRANQEFDRAIVGRDVVGYQRILSDDFIFTSFDGSLSDKTQELAKVKSGDLKFEYGRSDDIRVKVYGKTAVVTGRFTAKGQNKNRGFTFTERYTAVFVKQNGRWQMVAEHATEIKQQ